MRNLNAIKKRISAIKSTQKITNAMRLVSISKVQQFKRLQDSLAPYFNEVEKISKDYKTTSEANDKPILYVVYAPDLSLVSAYTGGLFRFIKEKEVGDFYWVGTQGYDTAIKNGLNIINDKEHSDDVDLDELAEICASYLEKYNISLIIPEYGRGGEMSLTFDITPLNVVLDDNYDVIYYPNFQEVKARYRDIVLKAMIYYAYYASKFSEYTTRRIAMEAATNNADEMIEDLQLVYNRVRQEAITQEISELVSGMEA
ncbi:MAG: F0F1 ATP synthase subunit gamma [Erysipelothrix sp.]|nr:F0F1 ATP synthase subunit gamma [Erysipelothrix sp.]